MTGPRVQCDVIPIYPAAIATETAARIAADATLQSQISSSVISGGVVGTPGVSPTSNPTGADVIRIGKIQIAQDRLIASVNGLNYGQIWTDNNISSSSTKNGYIEFPNKIMFQWGYVDGSAGQDPYVTFPVAFSAGGFFSLSVAAVPGLSSGDPRAIIAFADNPSNYGFNVRTRTYAGGTVSLQAIGCLWMCVGGAP